MTLSPTSALASHEHRGTLASNETGPAAEAAGQEASDGPKVVVFTPEGMGVSGAGADDTRSPADLVAQPAKVMRIGSMIKQLLEEVRGAPLDDAGRARLAQIHARSISELKAGLAPELVDELDRIALPLRDEAPSDAELRIAQAQLVGWLEGLFHGIQTALFAQQMAVQQQLQSMRALPPGHPEGEEAPGAVPLPGGPTGQYL